MNVAAEPTTRGETGLIAVDSVPATWRPSTIRQLTRPVSRKGFPDLPVLSVYRDYGVILKDSRDDNHNATGEDLTQYKAVYPGDLVLNKMKTWQGSLGVSDHEGLVSPAYITCETIPDENRRFLHYLLRSTPYIHEYHRISFGVRVGQWDMRYEDFREIPVYLPPRPEQDAIVAYLDGKLEAIDRYLRVKEREIALLEERKRALIHRAVTRGLDPNPKLRSSGSDWWGQIPAHWAFKRLYRITDPARPIMYGIVLPGPSVSDGVYIVKGGNCEPGKLEPRFMSKTTREIESSYIRSRLQENDLVYSIRGSIGSAQLVPTWLAGGNLTQDAARIAPGPGIVARWLRYAVETDPFFLKLEAGALGAAVKGINIRDLKRAEIAIPPADEQAAIADYLGTEVAPITTTINRARRQIERMQEYRTSLIAEAVTGKIDVKVAS